jgi:hypothetical protein
MSLDGKAKVTTNDGDSPRLLGPSHRYHLSSSDGLARSREAKPLLDVVIGRKRAMIGLPYRGLVAPSLAGRVMLEPGSSIAIAMLVMH